MNYITLYIICSVVVQKRAYFFSKIQDKKIRVQAEDRSSLSIATQSESWRRLEGEVSGKMFGN
jgi:hypothetical protein